MSRFEQIQAAIYAALGNVKLDYRSPKRLDEAAGQIAKFVEGVLKTPRVVVQFDEHGNPSFYSASGEVDLLIIDERCPRDRVYLHGSHKSDDEFVDRLIGFDRIGRLGDMPGTEAAIRAAMDGKEPPRPSLCIVPGDQS